MLETFARRHRYVRTAAMFQQAALLACLGRNLRDQFQAVLDIFDGGTLVEFLYRPLVFPPSLALWRKDDHFFLAIYGTKNPWQYLGHLTGAVFSKTRGPYSSNSFFAGMADHHIKPLLHPYIRSGELKSLSMAGHSYGGGCATVMGLQFAGRHISLQDYGRVELDRVEVMTFGAPRSVGDDWPRSSYPDEWFHVYHTEDPVPKMPPRIAQNITNRFTGGKFFSGPLSEWWTHLAERVIIDNNGDIVELEGEDDAVLGALPDIDEPVDLDKHGMDNYLRLVRRRWLRYYRSPLFNLLASRVEQILAAPFNEPEQPFINPSTYIDLREATNLYLGQGERVLEPDEVVHVESLSLALNAPEFREFSNIGDSVPPTPVIGEEVNVAVSGLWNCTLFINNSLYGRSETHTWNGGGASTIEMALDKAKILASKRAHLFGEDTPAAPNQVKNLGTPWIEYIRVVDARNPRYGQLFDVKANNYIGYNLGTAKPADVLSTTLSTRLRGQNVDDENVVHYSNLILCGQPDDAVQSGQLVPTFDMNGGDTLGEEILKYITHLTTVGNGWGFMGLPSTDPGDPFGQAKLDIEGFELNEAGMWVANVEGHGYVTGDKVNITKANVSIFSGVYTVKRIDDDHFALLNGPKVETPAATFAQVQRIQNKDGLRFSSFYKFLQPIGGVNLEALGFKVRTVKLSREFHPITFHRRGSRAS